MHRWLLILTTLVALIATACGDDADVSTGAEPDGPEPPLGAGPYPIADLTFTIRPDGPDGVVETYRLACLGDTATVVDGDELTAGSARCLALNDVAVRSRLLDGAPADQICTQVYGGPETAAVTGTLDGATVDTEFHRADGCGIADWDLFAEFLPAPA